MVTKIVINQSKCKILDEDDFSNIQALDNELSFKIKGIEHSDGFKNGWWDGITRMLDQSGGAIHFSRGFLDRVKKFYDDRKVKYELIDARTNVTQPNPIDIIPKLAEMGKKPYQFQLEASEKVDINSHGIFRLPTGSGKSLLSALITARIGKKTILYVIGKDLLYQMHKLYSEVFDEPIGIIGDGHCEIHNINIATVWTISAAVGIKKIPKSEEESKEKKIEPEKYRLIRDMLGQARVHIWDECHLCAAPSLQEIGKLIVTEHVYGMSASPWRDDGADLLIESLLGQRIVDIPAKWLIENGFLVKPKIRFVTVPKKRGIGKKYPEIYKNYITENEVRNGMIVNATLSLIKQGFVTLVLFNSLKHGDILYEMLSEKINCYKLSGDDSTAQRDLVRNKLESGEIKCILVSKIFDIGVDLPILSGLVIASGGKSSVRALQRIGRVIRKYPNKTMAAVVDFADQAKYLLDHSKVRNKIYSWEFDVQWPEQL